MSETALEQYDPSFYLNSLSTWIQHWLILNNVFSPSVGFMTPEERKVFENVRSPHLKYWIPVVWFSNLASKARQEGRIQDSIDLQNILNVTIKMHFYGERTLQG